MPYSTYLYLDFHLCSMTKLKEHSREICQVDVDLTNGSVPMDQLINWLATIEKHRNSIKYNGSLSKPSAIPLAQKI